MATAGMPCELEARPNAVSASVKIAPPWTVPWPFRCPARTDIYQFYPACTCEFIGTRERCRIGSCIHGCGGYRQGEKRIHLPPTGARVPPLFANRYRALSARYPGTMRAGCGAEH